MNYREVVRDLGGPRLDTEPYDSPLVYRGAADCRWKLVSSYDRLADDCRNIKKVNIDDYYAEYIKHYERTIKEIGLYSADQLISNTLENMWTGQAAKSSDKIEALAQHRGLPTKLIDWSASPYIAAYFAYRDAPLKNRSADGCVSIWVLDVDMIRENYCSADDNQQIIQVLTDRHSGNRRQLWQYGLFTKINSPERNFVDVLGVSYKTPTRPVVYRFDIPLRSFLDAMADLASMRISGATLFPGHDGVVYECKERMRLLLHSKGVKRPTTMY